MLDLDSTQRQPKVNSRIVRQFSVTLLGITGAVVWKVNLFKVGLFNFQSFIVLLVVSLGIIGLVYPNRLRLGLMVIMALTHPIGSFVSFVVLGIYFYLVFTPFALLKRMLGRDTLSLKHSGEQSSYWKDNEDKNSKESYFRQS